MNLELTSEFVRVYRRLESYWCAMYEIVPLLDEATRSRLSPETQRFIAEIENQTQANGES